jgi:hypothetical protein
MVSSLIVSCVQRAAAAALEEKSVIGISPVTTRSWLPASERSHLSRASSTQPSGWAP